MATTILQGPCIITFNSATYYFSGPVTLNFNREIAPIDTDMFGPVSGGIFKSDKCEITAPLAGVITATVFGKLFPYTHASVGSSVITGALLIHSKTQGQTISWAKAGLVASPQLRLRPTQTPLGDVKFVAIGNAAVARTDAAYWNTVATLAFSDVSFNPSQILVGKYTAAIGARLTPLNAVTAQEGFIIDVPIATRDVLTDDDGVADVILTSLESTLSFAPTNLVEADLATLMEMESTGAWIPGAKMDHAAEDIVCTCSTNGVTVTFKNAGARGYSQQYGTAVHRHRGVTFVGAPTFTTGVPAALVTLAIA